MVVSNSEHVWKGSKGTKHWPHVYVSGVSARTCFTLKLATPEQRACVNNMQTSQRIRFWFFRTVFSQEGQIAVKILYFLKNKMIKISYLIFCVDNIWCYRKADTLRCCITFNSVPSLMWSKYINSIWIKPQNITRKDEKKKNSTGIQVRWTEMVMDEENW